MMAQITRRISEDNMVTKDDVCHYAFTKPKTTSSSQAVVQEFIRTPMDRFFTTSGVPGIGGRLANFLKMEYGVSSPRELVEMLRYKTRSYPRRLPLHVKASLVANFLDQVWFHKNVTLKSNRNKRKAAISIAVMEWRWMSSSSKDLKF